MNNNKNDLGNYDYLQLNNKFKGFDSASDVINTLGGEDTSSFQSFLDDTFKLQSADENEWADVFSFDKTRAAFDEERAEGGIRSDSATNVLTDIYKNFGRVAGGLFQDIVLDPAEVLLPQGVEDIAAKGVETAVSGVSSGYAGLKDIAKDTDTYKGMSQEDKQWLSGQEALTGAFVGAVGAADLGLGGFKGNLTKSSNIISKTKNIPKIKSELKGFGFSGSEIGKLSEYLKNVDDADLVSSHLSGQITNKIIEKNIGKDLSNLDKRKYTTNELANINDKYLASKIGKMSDEATIEKLGYTNDTTALTERVFNNELENLRATGAGTNNVFREVIARRYNGLKYWDKLDADLKVSMKGAKKDEWVSKVEKELKDKDGLKNLTRDDLEDIYIANKEHVENIAKKYPEKADEVIAKKRNELSRKELDFKKKKEADVKKELSSGGMIKKVEAEELGYVSAKTGKVSTRPKLEMITKDIKETLNKKGVTFSPDELDLLHKKIRYVNQSFERNMTGNYNDLIKLASEEGDTVQKIGDNSFLIDLEDAKVVKRLEDKLGKQYKDVWQEMRLPNGVKLKDVYRVSVSRDGTFQYAISKQEHKLLIDSVKKRGYNEANRESTIGKAWEGVTNAFEHVQDGLIPRAFAYSKYGLDQIFNKIKDTYNAKVSARKYWTDELVKSGYFKVSKLDDTVSTTLSKTEDKNIQNFIITSQRGLKKGDARYKSWDDLTSNEKGFVEITDKFIKATTDDKFAELRASLGDVNKVENYRPLSGDIDKINEAKKSLKAKNVKSPNWLEEMSQEIQFKGDRVSSYNGLSVKPRIQSRKAEVDSKYYTDTYSDVFLKNMDDTLDIIYDTSVKREVDAIINDKNFKDEFVHAWGEKEYKHVKTDLKRSFGGADTVDNLHPVVKKTLSTMSKVGSGVILGLSIPTALLQPLGLVGSMLKGKFTLVDLFKSMTGKTWQKSMSKYLDEVGIKVSDNDLGAVVSRSHSEYVEGLRSNGMLDKTVSGVLKPLQWADVGSASLTARANTLASLRRTKQDFHEIVAPSVEAAIRNANREIDLTFAGSHMVDRPKWFQNYFGATLSKMMYPATMQFATLFEDAVRLRGWKGQVPIQYTKAMTTAFSVMYIEQVIRTFDPTPYSEEQGGEMKVKDMTGEFALYVLGSTLPMINNIAYSISTGKTDMGSPLLSPFLTAAKEYSMWSKDGDTMRHALSAVGFKKANQRFEMITSGMEIDPQTGKVINVLSDWDKGKMLFINPRNSDVRREFEYNKEVKSRNKLHEKRGEELEEYVFTSPLSELQTLSDLDKNKENAKRASQIFLGLNEEDKIGVLQALSFKTCKTIDKERKDDTPCIENIDGEIDYSSPKVKGLMKQVVTGTDPAFYKDIEKYIKSDIINFGDKSGDEARASVSFTKFLNDHPEQLVNITDAQKKKYRKWKLANEIDGMTDYGIKEALKERGINKRPSKANVAKVKYYNLIINDGDLPQEVKSIKKIESLKDSQVKKGLSNGSYTKEELDYVFDIYDKLIDDNSKRSNVILDGWMDNEMKNIINGENVVKKKKYLENVTRIWQMSGNKEEVFNYLDTIPAEDADLIELIDIEPLWTK